MKREGLDAYGVLLEDEGIALRGTFIIDPDGLLRYSRSLGRVPGMRHDPGGRRRRRPPLSGNGPRVVRPRHVSGTLQTPTRE
jgi:hypothetical protein